jgi:hypothetical protein
VHGSDDVLVVKGEALPRRRERRVASSGSLPVLDPSDGDTTDDLLVRSELPTNGLEISS